jgi:hypothetical protein
MATAEPGWVVDGDRAWLRIPPSAGDRLGRRLPPWILATDRADVAGQMFGGRVSWSQQHQVGFLLRPGPLPMLGRQLVLDLMAARDASIAALALPADVIALALPGVDGDLLEIVARAESTRAAIHAAIVRECGGRGVAFRDGPPGPTP